MKLEIKRAVKIIALILPVALLAAIISYGVVGGANDSLRIRDFYLEEPNSLDVVILGASEVYSDFSPGEAYARFGFTSYPFAYSQNHVDLFLSELEEIFKTQTPSVVVVDINGAVYDEPITEYDQTLRRYVEGMPLSWNKIRTIHEYGQKEHLLSYYIPLIMYHGNVNIREHVSKCLSRFFTGLRGYSLLKGNVSFLVKPEFSEIIDAQKIDGELPLTVEAEEKLVELLEFCKQQDGTKFVFTSFPHVIDGGVAYDRLRKVNYAEHILNRYGYELINLEKQFGQIGLDPYEDFYDTEHMNVWGQRKFTQYFGKILVEDCGVEPRALSEKVRGQWEQAAMYRECFYQYSVEQKQNGSREMLWESWKMKRLLDALRTAQ